MKKIINFQNKTDHMVRMSYLNLKTRYKIVTYPKASNIGGLLTGWFIVN